MGRAISSAIAHAGLAKEAIGYFDAHGTGTEANDAAEWRAIKRVFGAHAEQLPVSATKSYFGHTLGAAGIIELAAALLSMQRGRLPTTLHFTRKRAFAPKKLVVGHPSRQSDHCYAVAHNAAFGGANATLVIGREPGRPPPRQCSAPAVEPVVAIGWGVLGAPESPGSQHHLQAGAPLWTALWRCGERADPDQADPLPDAHIAAGTVRSALRGLDVRGFDRNSKLLTAAANLALLDASVRVRGPLRDRIGIMVGANRLPWDSADDFWGATRSRGLDRASAPAFSRIVMNAAAGACSRALSLRGPLSVFAEGVGGCLRATLLGAEMLSRRDDLDLLLVGSAYELGHGMCEDLAYQRLHGPLPPAGEAAAVVLLAKRSFARAHDLTARAILRASALSGPADPASSLRQCLAAGACAPSAVDAVFIAASDAQSEAAARAALALTFGEKPKNLLEYLPATAVGTGESMDAVGLAAACQAVSSPPVAPPAGPRRPSGPTRCALVFAVNELTGATAALVQAAV